MYLVFVHVHVKPDCREGFIRSLSGECQSNDANRVICDST